jgi:23S rRNA (guanosine2251-2'-O)-methyltransferase
MARVRRRVGADERRELIYGVHPVNELLEGRLRSVERLYVAHEAGAGLGSILRRARRAGIPVTRLPRQLLGRKVGLRARHQGIAAVVSPIDYADPEELCARSALRPTGTLVLLDRLVDAGNLGAVLRASAAAGADGVLLAGAGTVGLTPGVAKSSAGAVERLPVARERSLVRRVEQLKRGGFLTLTLDPRGERDWDDLDLSGRLAVVAGGEGRGVRPVVARACDLRVAIPLDRGVESMNVAVAVGVLLFEAVRQRRRSVGRP